jgi:glyoxylase-like metal-dependent hydrolase (beta-lactamase superfamily II)
VLEIHAYDPRTFVLREGFCSTWEAPFLYLLVGTRSALLIDTGDVADEARVPLRSTVLALLPGGAASPMPLTVVHTHGHLDHRVGDVQFQGRPGVEVVPADLEHVRAHFGFSDWPRGVAEIDLGDRVVDVLPAPGHHRAHLLYYDRKTALLLSGDFLLPGRLLVDDISAYRESARRIADFVRERPVSAVLGGHIEKNRAGALLEWQSTRHADERDLALTKADVLALPAALDRFNGFYTVYGDATMMDSIRILEVLAVVLVLLLFSGGVLARRWLRRRRKRVA